MTSRHRRREKNDCAIWELNFFFFFENYKTSEQQNIVSALFGKEKKDIFTNLESVIFYQFIVIRLGKPKNKKKRSETQYLQKNSCGSGLKTKQRMLLAKQEHSNCHKNKNHDTWIEKRKLCRAIDLSRDKEREREIYTVKRGSEKERKNKSFSQSNFYIGIVSEFSNY